MKKIFAFITAVSAAAAVSVTAGAYSINKDLGFGWSASTTISGSEFETVTPETNVTITFEVNQSLAEMEGHDYWCIKPMINDAGWPFINNLYGLTLSEAGDSYSIDPETTSISFNIPAEELEHIQVAGMAIMGHGIELLEMTFSDEPVSAPVEAAPADDTPAAPAEDTAVDTPVSGESTNPDTGVSGIAAAAGCAMIAAGALIYSRKR